MQCTIAEISIDISFSRQEPSYRDRALTMLNAFEAAVGCPIYNLTKEEISSHLDWIFGKA